MTKKVTVVDYGVGNLFSVRGALEHLGAEVVMGKTPEDIRAADRLLLPGVGAFGDAMDDMVASGLISSTLEARGNGRPFLGICLGMQMLFDDSSEFGHHDGLAMIGGSVVAIPDIDSTGAKLRIPHVGWNELHPSAGADWSGTILDGVAERSTVYFVHSYMASPIDPSHRLADTIYGGHSISAVVQKDNVFGCQFHPEKSGEVGLKLISNFLAC